MSKIYSHFAITSVLISSLAIFGCSSDDGGGAAAPTVPTGAVVITEANAKDVVSDALGVGNDLVNSLPTLAEIDQTPLARDIINLAISKVKNVTSETGLNIPTGVDFLEPCDNPSGTISGSYTESGNTISGTITFTDCTVFGITFNGTLDFAFSFDDVTGAFSDDLQGTISGSDGVETATLSNLHFNESGNLFMYNYSLNNYDFTADFTGGGGFLVELIEAIVGDMLLICPSSGEILVTGANGTQAMATINSDDTVKIEFNDGSGTFVEVTEPPPGSPFPCTEFFTGF